jgi:hypothetical protein
MALFGGIFVFLKLMPGILDTLFTFDRTDEPYTGSGSPWRYL